jgi:glycosyltransferase involved in cell wall biosynthesis
MCQAVDLEDPVSPTTVNWIDALARKPIVGHVTVLALREGRHELPANVDVVTIRRSNRLATAAAFYRQILAALRNRPDCFLVYQGGPYPLMLLPFKYLGRIPIVQWKAHPYISRMMAFYARWCDDLVLTSARAAFPMDLEKVRVVGQGVDTHHFKIEPRTRRADLIAVGRLAPTKRIGEMIRAVAAANVEFGTQYTLNVCGPTLEGREEYARRMTELVAELGAEAWVSIDGPVRQEHLPELLNAHRACLNFTVGALDKTAVEAMACGLPIISTNDAVAEVLPRDLRPLLISDKFDTELQAAAIHGLLSKTDDEIEQIGVRLRDMVASNHSTDGLLDRILEEIEALLQERA